MKLKRTKRVVDLLSPLEYLNYFMEFRVAFPTLNAPPIAVGEILTSLLQRVKVILQFTIIRILRNYEKDYNIPFNLKSRNSLLIPTPFCIPLAFE